MLPALKCEESRVRRASTHQLTTVTKEEDKKNQTNINHEGNIAVDEATDSPAAASSCPTLLLLLCGVAMNDRRLRTLNHSLKNTPYSCQRDADRSHLQRSGDAETLARSGGSSDTRRQFGQSCDKSTELPPGTVTTHSHKSRSEIWTHEQHVRVIISGKSPWRTQQNKTDEHTTLLIPHGGSAREISVSVTLDRQQVDTKEEEGKKYI